MRTKASTIEAVPRPFIKWVGGKRQLLPVLRERVPEFSGRYYEPFIGGGALFFALRPKRALLADMNERLVRTYRGVRDSPTRVISLLKKYPHEKEFFLDMRTRDIDSGTDAEVAAWFIYLNRTGYNGLYRVNRHNRFNVPFGRYMNPVICDAANIQACARALEKVDIRHQDFAQTVARARAGDFVYFDPPYVPLSATSQFVSYTSKGFTMEDQTRLRDLAHKLKARGVHVLISNSSAHAVRELYADFEQQEVPATRAINSKARGRGAIKELVMF